MSRLKKKIVILTPDYPPKRMGGISTLTLSFERALNDLDLKTEIIQWDRPHKIVQDADHYVSMHSWILPYLNHEQKQKTVNVIHGTEIIPSSPNWLKRQVKKVYWSKMWRAIESVKHNLFISAYTQSLAESYGMTLNFKRDLVIHNRTMIDESQSFISKTIDNELVICALARDVEHKNLSGIISLCEKFQQFSGKAVTLYLSHGDYRSQTIKVITKNLNESEKIEIFKKSHLNILLSKDLSHKGFVEGFGLTPLEAALYSTPSLVSSFGGLSESVHHKITGYVLDNVSDHSIQECLDFLKHHYHTLSKQCYEHTFRYHNEKDYSLFLKALL